MSSSTIIVRFLKNASEEEIDDLLGRNRIRGIEVSSFTRRWALEVSPGTEEQYADILRKSDIVAAVCSNFIKGFKPEKKHGSETGHSDQARSQNEKGEGMRPDRPRLHDFSDEKVKSRKKFSKSA